MAKKKPVTTSRLVMVSGTLSLNGETTTLHGVNYSRAEYSDGSVVETGRPAGLPAGSSVGDVIRYVFEATEPKPAVKNKGRRR